MIRSFTFLFVAAALLAGCNAPGYINVPNDGKDLAINGPNQLTVVKIEKEALDYLLSKSMIPGDIALRLPEGTLDTKAIEITSYLSKRGYNVYPEGQTPSDEYRLVEVREISARFGRARVDMIRPGKLRERELVEVYLDWGMFTGWVPERLQARNIDVKRIDSQLLAAPGAKPKASAFPPIEQPAEDAAEDVEDAAEDGPAKPESEEEPAE